MTGSLDGLLIADFSRVLAGPYATMLLGDLGAEVVKIERPGRGDDTREWGPPFDARGVATYFGSVNRNKRSVALDLALPEGRADARELVLEADVVVENFRPGSMERFGLGYDDLAQEHPGLVYCSITGFGTGAGRDLPGYDLIVQAAGGLMSVTGHERDQRPTKAGVALVDVITGLHASLGILAAIRHRDQTGLGQRVEVSLLASLLSALVNQSAAYVAGGVVPGIMDGHPSIVPYAAFETADGPLVIGVGNDGQFTAFAEVLGMPELSSDPRFATNPARVEHRTELLETVREPLRARARGDLTRALSAAGVPCSPINDIAAAFALASDLGLDPVVEIAPEPGGEVARQIRNPITLSRTPATYRSPPPSFPGRMTGDG